MLKKFVFLLFIYIMLFCICSCKKIIEDNNISVYTENNTITLNTKSTDKNDCTPENNNHLKTIDIHLSDFTFDLYNWQTNEITNKIEYPNNEIMNRYFVLQNGYATFSFVSNLPIKIDENKRIKIPKKFDKKIVRLYDTKLNILREIEIGRFIPDVTLIDLFSIDISLDGKKIALAYKQNLYVYDIDKDNLIKIFENTNIESMDFLNIKFTKEADSIVYYGYIVEDENNLINYGIINLENSEMINFNYKTKFKARDIKLSSNYACIIDEEDGKPPVASGSVLIIDLKNKKSFDIKVDLFESTMSTLSYDETYLVSTSKLDNNTIQVRQYSFDSKPIKEKIYKLDDETFYPVNIIAGQKSNIYILLSNNNDRKYIEFTCEEK